MPRLSRCEIRVCGVGNHDKLAEAKKPLTWQVGKQRGPITLELP